MIAELARDGVVEMHPTVALHHIVCGRAGSTLDPAEAGT